MGIVESTYAELKQQELKNNPYSCLHMADIDINPHQIEAFTFALSSLELGGAILADEVGLGKTIEAGLVIKYLLCSGKNKILLIMPSNLRKQWQVELEEKFDIDSLIVDSSNWEDYLAKVKSKQAVIIVSYHFASKRKAEFGKIAWDFCVFDEAHRLRNVYKNGSKMANSLYELTKGIPKILLTATPMQNTLLDIYGLVQFIDDRVFYSKQIFSERYLRGEDYNDLKQKFNDESILPESNRRLDFLCTNSAGVIHVIELKRPRIKLTMKEIQQICEYVEFIETQFPQTQGNVKGFLISDNMTYEPGANKYRKGLEKEGIFIKSYSDLLAEARRYNDDLYKMYEDISMKKNNKSDK